MIIDLLATILEEIILSSSIAYLLKIKNLLYYILITSIICIIQTFIFSYIYINNFILIVLIIFTHSVILILFKKKNILQNIMTVTFFMLMLLVSNYLSLYLFSLLENIPILELSQYKSIFYSSVIFSKFVFLFLSSLICLYFRKKNENIILEKNGIVSLIVLDIVFIFTLLGEALVYNKISNTTILIIMLELIVLSILFCVLYYKLQLENEEKVKLIRETTKLEYLRKNSDKISQMYNVIISKEHSMIYLLRKISITIEDHNILDLINREIDKITSYKFISNTGNYIFDNEISNKINQLKDNGYDIKVIMMVHENSALNHPNIISQIIEFIEEIITYSKNNKIELRIKDVDNILVIKAISVFMDNKMNPFNETKVNEGKFESINKIIHLDDD